MMVSTCAPEQGCRGILSKSAEVGAKNQNSSLSNV